MTALVRVTTWTAWTLSAGLALAPREAVAQPQSANFENWKEPLKGRAPKASCDHLRSLTAYDFSIDNAVTVPARAKSRSSASCRTNPAEVRFEVALPKEWNGRLYMFGNGGYAGESLAFAWSPRQNKEKLEPSEAASTTAQTNTGHDASARSRSAPLHRDPQSSPTTLYRAIHVTAMTAKTVDIRTYYDVPSREVVLRRLLGWRPPGPHCGAALPRRLRRHRLRGAGRRLYRDNGPLHGDASGAGRRTDFGGEHSSRCQKSTRNATRWTVSPTA